ncbi:hypothetical protein I6E74_10050 [Salinibacterium sp. SWN139]|uniref:hypothetical protein n=1 Tax=Salinibacterium sp. SWN139 TaxID=2792055 RepID=UPI0018CDA368|nr:hypothetical protein [Salinibacterium sp. SWN139]MBH0054506.1 hypothetical protein [Salinibacterium sp. SWN139]
MAERENASYSRNGYKTSDQGGLIDAGSGYRAVVVDTPSSREFRDLISCRRDVELAKAFANAFIQMGVESVENAREPSLALWIAALTSYGRAFKSSVRTVKPNAEIFDTSDSEWHNYLVNLRDKHAAHAVNGYEQAFVLAFITDSSFARRSVDRVGHVHVDLFPSEEEVRAVSALSGKLLGDLNSRIRKIRPVISQEVEDMGLDAVYALPPALVPIHDPAAVAKRRM